MVKKDIVELISQQTGMPALRVKRVVDSTLRHIREALLRGERVELRRFGVFTVSNRKVGLARNPRTGESTPIPAGKRVKFKPGKHLAKIGE